MAVTLAELILIGLIADWVFRRIHLPGLVGMLGLGVIFGPFFLNLIHEDLLNISADLRMIALIVILLRAGFELSRRTLMRVGWTAIMLSCVPAILEGLAVTALGPPLLGLTPMQSALLGSILAAVSPAVVVPLMIRFIEQRKGVDKGIPTLVLAASSIDDVFVIVIYSALISLYTGQQVHLAWKLAGIPLAIAAGILVGMAMGALLVLLFERTNPRATKRVLILIGLAILLVRTEHLLEGVIPFAALLAVMAMGAIILERREHFAHELSSKLSKIWIFAEILLFTMVGAQVNVEVAWRAGLAGATLILLALIARCMGTWLCLWRSHLNFKERLFVVVAYLPKATVQAAIGGAPLAAMRMAGMDTTPGETILAVAVLSIVLTAPAGAWAINALGNRVLETAPEPLDTDLGKEPS